jgi:Xaa-Pro aminopeptidase
MGRIESIPMFQTYEDICDPSKAKKRVALLRAELKKQKLDGFWVPHTDEHQSEYLPPHAERLFWLTGFSGSAGTAIVLANKAAVFTDGRYTIQVREQVDARVFNIQHLIDQPPLKWLEKNLKKGQRLGFDPHLHSHTSAQALKQICEKQGARLIALKRNPIDTIWLDQPARPCGKVVPHPLKFAGEPAIKKLQQIAGILKQDKQDAFILTLADSLCWAFNIRGRDVAHTPVVLGHAIIKARGRHEIFIESAKLSSRTRSYIDKIATLKNPDRLNAVLERLGKNKKNVRLDPHTTSFAIYDRLKQAGACVINAQDPVINLKAIKNKTEIEGARSAHIRDAVAYCRFLNWLEEQKNPRLLSEISVAKKLEAFRTESGELRDISFDTISAFGPNGAICHYRVTQASNLRFKKGALFLIDSGAQYRDGTTDITRTIAIGRASAEMRRNFTLVLKGHIALAQAVFPQGISGSNLDVLARSPLWQQGLDFDHGTGHGVGSYLSVHEGPQRIAKTPSPVSLKPGMILSNEPGYYKDGEYGIRIENLVLVTTLDKKPGAEHQMLGFETLSWAPIDRTLVNRKMLSPTELKWFNQYHGQVYARISPLLGRAEKTWLKRACAPIR